VLSVLAVAAVCAVLVTAWWLQRAAIREEHARWLETGQRAPAPPAVSGAPQGPATGAPHGI
jgi:hypothetical protein